MDRIIIVGITLAHYWDGLELSLQDFSKVKEVLSLTGETHTIKYVMNGILYTEVI